MSKLSLSLCSVLLAVGISIADDSNTKSDAKSDSKSSMVYHVKSSGAVMLKSELAPEGDKVADLASGIEVTMIKEGKARSLVKSGDNRGWVDNSSLEKIKNGNSSRNLKDIEVQGWLDNPSAVYILDNSNAELTNLPLDRNFASDITEKKDREQVERTYDENK